MSCLSVVCMQEDPHRTCDQHVQEGTQTVCVGLRIDVFQMGAGRVVGDAQVSRHLFQVWTQNQPCGDLGFRWREVIETSNHILNPFGIIVGFENKYDAGGHVEAIISFMGLQGCHKHVERD